jgi:hypothetical protein
VSHRIVIGTALAALALLAAGCGGGDDDDTPPPVPQGFVREQGREWTFARPRDWSPIEAEPAPGKELLGFQSGLGPAGLPAQVGLGTNPRYTNELRQAVQLAKEQSEIKYPRYKVLDERELDLPGADAYRIDAEYETFQDGPVPVRTVDLLVQTSGGTQMNFFVRAAADDFERLDLERVVSTFRVR